jgi:hypothetical protein
MPIHIAGRRRPAARLDYTTNGDVADLATPLSHAALIGLHLQDRWPDERP